MSAAAGGRPSSDARQDGRKRVALPLPYDDLLAPIDNGRPHDPDFAALLAHYRQRRGLSQNALAKRAHINSSYVNRLESGERRRPTESVTFALARALHLSPKATDRLLLAAGYAPTWLRYLGQSDPTVAALAAALTDDRLDEAALADVRAAVEATCRLAVGERRLRP
jgi:transcriptional regulator with XRE-family HTH domain